MVLKNSFTLFFFNCIFEFLINTAAQGSNSVNGRENHFNTINFKNQILLWSHSQVVRNLSFWAGRSWGAGSNPGGATSSFWLLLF